MHRALAIPEIVGMIVDSMSLYDRRTLAILARTSRYFHELALDALWSTLYDFRALAKCMPDHLWEEVEIVEPQFHNRPSHTVTSIVSNKLTRLRSADFRNIEIHKACHPRRMAHRALPIIRGSC
jgi:hypothetical protein